MQAQRSLTLVIASMALVGLLALSGARPFDRTTWLLEAFPVLIAVPSCGGPIVASP
jgi:putative membrane protein